MREKDKKSIEIIMIILCFLALIIGCIINPQRTSPTIPSFPQFVYIEHIVGNFAVAVILFYIMYFILKYSVLKKRVALFFSGGFSAGSTLSISICYEVVRKSCELINWGQVMADFIGIVMFLLLFIKLYKIS